jgi:hypothetical protein
MAVAPDERLSSASCGSNSTSEIDWDRLAQSRCAQVVASQL